LHKLVDVHGVKIHHPGCKRMAGGRDRLGKEDGRAVDRKDVVPERTAVIEIGCPPAVVGFDTFLALAIKNSVYALVIPFLNQVCNNGLILSRG
jgi:hypothetical protein